MNSLEEDFEREKILYEQNFEQLRAMNSHMNNLPTLCATITGALWYAVGSLSSVDTSIKFTLLLLNFAYNLSLIIALLRLRDVFQSYIEIIEEFHPLQKKQGKPMNPRLNFLKGYSMVYIYSAMMAFSCIASLVIAISYYWIFPFDRMFALYLLSVFSGVIILLNQIYKVIKQ